MRKKKRKPYSESWCFRELEADFTCAFVVRIDYDEEGRMTGRLAVKLPEGQWNFDYAHPVNMNLRGSLFLVLDKNVFTEACIHLDIDESDLRIKGDIYFDREYGGCLIGLSRKIWAMEQELSGELMVNGRDISFDGGKGYLEEWKGNLEESLAFWSQCNWFGEKAVRIVCGGRERHCFAIFDQDGYRVRLTGWKGARVEYVNKQGFRMVQGRYVLEGWCSEGSSCTVRYRLTHRGEVLFDEISQRAVYWYNEKDDH